MAFSQAEKQRRYRERHLGYDLGKNGFERRKKRIQYFVSFHTWVKLGRLAHYYDCSITTLVEKLIADAENAVIDQIPASSVSAYYGAELQRNPSPTLESGPPRSR